MPDLDDGMGEWTWPHGWGSETTAQLLRRFGSVMAAALPERTIA